MTVESSGASDALDQPVGARLRRQYGAAQDGIEGPLHVAGGEQTAVAEAHPPAQVEDISHGIENLPALGQAGDQVEVLVAVDQAVEEQGVDALGLRVGAHARIEIRRARLDDHHQRGGRGLFGAAGREQGCCKAKSKTQGAQRETQFLRFSACSAFCLKHARSCPEWRVVWRRSPLGRSMDGDARSHTPAARRLRLPSRRRARRIRRRSAT